MELKYKIIAHWTGKRYFHAIFVDFRMYGFRANPQMGTKIPLLLEINLPKKTPFHAIVLGKGNCKNSPLVRFTLQINRTSTCPEVIVHQI